jgi:hypothetical protein
MSSHRIGASNFQSFNGETNVTAQERFSSSNVQFRLIIRVPIAVEKVTSTRDFGRKVFRETITRSLFRVKGGRRFDQPTDERLPSWWEERNKTHREEREKRILKRLIFTTNDDSCITEKFSVGLVRIKVNRESNLKNSWNCLLNP